MALHEQSVVATDEWYTPWYVFQALGAEFDMDVASPADRRYANVPAHGFISAGSLDAEWAGFIWMNPPFGARNGLVPWLDKFFSHGDGVCLVPDRTSAPWWQSAARRADGVLFVDGKIKFIGADGLPGKSPAQGTTLMSVGSRGLEALARAEDAGLGHLMKNIKF